MFRQLYKSEIEVRVSRTTEKGVFLLLYKDARCDMNILDETVEPFNWQREHQLIGDVMYCGVSIKDKDGMWVTKWDAGTESNTEKEKGQASDSFKRACFNWGIGRSLYTAPLIYIPIDKYQKYDRFQVTLIDYDLEGISSLNIRNQRDEIIYRWRKQRNDN
jgi:hypothetical protein